MFRLIRWFVFWLPANRSMDAPGVRFFITWTNVATFCKRNFMFGKGRRFLSISFDKIE